MTSSEAPVALITGANRGIGLEIVRQLAERGYVTLLGSRSQAAGQQAADQLGLGDHVVTVQLDVTNPDSIRAVRSLVEERYGRLDVLVNNAGIHYDTWQRATDADLTIVHEALETNLFGAWRTAQAFTPLLRRSPHPRIVNVSSEGGSLTAMGGGAPAYRASKAALNALTRMLAAELRSDGIVINAICPGWVATDMGGPGGRPVHEAAAGVLWAVDLPDSGPSGGFYRDGRPLPW